MLELYELINSNIESICSCYADHYPEDLEKAYPYAEISFPNISPNNTFSNLNLLQIDIWDDKSTDIREIEGIADEIDKRIKKLQINNDTMQVCIYRNNPYRLKLNDPEVHIQRRQLRYIVRVYYK